ncbi:MAG: tetratricopeptide repeat protein [Thermodesulfobacteriota bacterium]|nr:tetratricopeptide repeat protein [Thermodesulfobacteriota bacterium]
MCLRELLVILLVMTASLVPWDMATADDCVDAITWYNEGLALSDNSEREVSYYIKAIELCPEYFEAYNRLGEVYKTRRQFELAIAAFEQASRKSMFVEPHYGLGEVYKMQGRYDLAAEAFTEAIRIRPDFREAHNQLKYTYKRLGKYDFLIDTPPDPIPSAIFTRIPGMTLPKGAFLFDMQYRRWLQEADISQDIFVRQVPPQWAAPSKRESAVQVWILGIRYGLTNDLTVGLLPKFFSRQAEVPIRYWKIDAEPVTTGFGDTVFLTKYRLWGKARTHLSAYHLLSIPTGDEDAEDEDEQILRKLPLGSGTYDFTPGLAFTTVRHPLTIHTDVWYVFTGGRQAGDEFHWDLAIALPRFHGFIAFMELNYRWRDDAERQQYFQARFGFPGGILTREATIKEKGGHNLFISPGVQVTVAKGLKAELGVQIPLMKPKDGWAEELVVHLGLRKYFF